MKRFTGAVCSLLALCMIAFAAPSQAEELSTIFGRVNDLVAKKNYAKALEELGWARRELEKRHRERLESFFPEQLGDYVGGKLDTNSALGFTNIERTYTKGSTSVKVSLTGESSSGGQGLGGGLGGIMALGKMAAMLGDQAGQETLRINGHTAVLNAPDGSDSSDLTLFLDAGSILKFEQYNGSDAAILRALAEKLDVSGLENYLKGNA